MIKLFFFLLFGCFCCCGYAQPGLLDPSFGNGGIIRADLGIHINNPGKGIQVITNGVGEIFMLYQTERRSFIAKKKSDGSPDSAYGSNGYSNRVEILDAKAVQQSDGKILIAGRAINPYQSRYNDAEFALARFNTNGSLDSTFGDGGMVIRYSGYDEYIEDVAIQSDGKIIVTGNHIESGSTSFRQYAFVTCYDKDGSLDKTFSDGGFKKLESSGFSFYATSVAVQADDKIIIGGMGESFGPSLMRFNKDGTPSNEPYGLYSFESGDVSDIAVQPDGKIILCSSSFSLLRLNENGLPDSSFGTNGLQLPDFRLPHDIYYYNERRSLLLQGDGKIILSGSEGTYVDTAHFVIARYNPDGKPDSSFSGDGNMIIDFASSNYHTNSVVPLNDGKLITLGYTGRDSNTTVTLVRYNSNGTNDLAFGNNGSVKDNLSGGSTFFTCNAEQIDCKVVAAGYTWNGDNYDFILARYNADGTPDSTFDGDGIKIIDLGADDRINSIALRIEGKIIVAGSSGNDMALARYNEVGEPDLTFGNTGIVVSDFGGIDYANVVALKADGKIVAGGSTVVRYNKNGIIDSSFGTNGKVGIGYQCRDIEVLKSGTIAVLWDAGAGIVTWYNEYGDKNKEAFISDRSGSATNVTANSLTVQKDGKILVCGKFEYSGRSYSSTVYLTRFNTNGTYDRTFNKGEILFVPMLWFGTATSVLEQEDGKIILAGYGFNRRNYDFVLSRYNPDGSRDSSFGPYGTQIISPGNGDDKLLNVTLACNNHLYAVGYSTGNPGTYGIIIRLYPSSEGGSLPVTLASFKASLQNKNVLLQWQTEVEESLAGFDIQRSDDGVHFISIGYVAANGSISASANYSLVDNQPIPGLNYYRLKMVDIDGKYTYSITATLRLAKEAIVIQLSPNPTRNILYIEAAAGIKEAAVKIIGADGKKWKEMKVYFNSDKQKVDISGLPRGMYIMQVQTKSAIETLQFLKE